MTTKNKTNVPPIPHQVKLELLREIIKAQKKCLIELYAVDPRDTLRMRLSDYFNRARHCVEQTKDLGCDCVVGRESTEPMPLDQATILLSDGHSVVSPETAYRICKAVGVEYPKSLECHGFSDFQFKGLSMEEDSEGKLIVDCLNLSEYIVGKLGIEVRCYFGRGSQANANAQAVKSKLEKLAGA